VLLLGATLALTALVAALSSLRALPARRLRSASTSSELPVATPAATEVAPQHVDAPTAEDFARLIEFPESPTANAAATIRAAYHDGFFGHLTVRRGWRVVAFTPHDAAAAFAAASEVAAVLRRARDERSGGAFVLRQVDGAAQAVLWDTAAPPPPPLPRGAWEAELTRRLAHATLSDGVGYVEGFHSGVIDAAIAARAEAMRGRGGG